MLNLKYRTLFALMLASGMQQSVACDLHGGMGFGFFGGAKTVSADAPPEYRAPQLKLFHPYFLRVTTGEQHQMDIGYHTPIGFEQAKLRITTSSGLELSGQDLLALDGPEGSQTLAFVATAPGKQSVTLTMESVNQGKPVSLIRRIHVNATATN